MLSFGNLGIGVIESLIGKRFSLFHNKELDSGRVYGICYNSLRARDGPQEEKNEDCSCTYGVVRWKDRLAVFSIL